MAGGDDDRGEDDRGDDVRGDDDRPVYPGPRQILRYLRLEYEHLAEGGLRARTPVLPDLLDPGGAMLLGALAPMCDLGAGVLTGREVAPDWAATLDFKLHLAAEVVDGHVEAHCRTLRAGKNTVLSELHLSDSTGRPVGESYVTFSRLPRRTDNPQGARRADTGRPVRLTDGDGEEPRIPLDDYLGLRFDRERPVIELDHHHRIYNSFGSIQGGAMGALLSRAASYAADRAWDAPARTVDLHFSYTAQARKGPFRLTATPISTDTRSALSRVELVDTGMHDRLAAVGTARAVPVDR